MIGTPQEPLIQLVDVPVDEYYHLKLRYQVETRGGVCTRTGRTEYMSERYGLYVVYIYTIKLPPGTYRVMEERQGAVHPYVVHFPDGHKMNGSIIHKETVLPGEQATIETLYPIA
jgi:hypothetical protein